MNYPQIICLALACFYFFILPAAIFGKNGRQSESANENAADGEKSIGKTNIKTKTLGGMQFWTDVLHFNDWRIQQNAMTKHYRLLSPKGTRYGWGNYAHCLEELEKIKHVQSLPLMDGKAIILVHGLGRSRESMEPLARYFREHSDYRIINVSYASTRGSLAEHANELQRILENLEGIEEINFVGHSLGNLVIRRCLQEMLDPETGKPQDPRIRRMVMLGPPNNGAQLAERFLKFGMFKLVLGRSAIELAHNWETLSENLAIPPFEFGIIAGNGGRLSNPLIEGESDLIVSTNEAKLPGAIDFRVINGMHTFLMQSSEAQKMTLSFLQNGYFSSRDAMQPIENVQAVEEPSTNE